jgi:catechol-2,3-dioxygenase
MEDYSTEDRPELQLTALDTTDVRSLAEFYRQLLGLVYRPGDDRPPVGTTDEASWLILTDRVGVSKLAFQHVDELPRTTWPRHDVPQQLHLDMTVPDRAALERHRERAIALGAELRLDRTYDAEEPLYALADPAGHIFCIFVR